MRQDHKHIYTADIAYWRPDIDGSQAQIPNLISAVHTGGKYRVTLFNCTCATPQRHVPVQVQRKRTTTRQNKISPVRALFALYLQVPMPLVCSGIPGSALGEPQRSARRCWCPPGVAWQAATPPVRRL